MNIEGRINNIIWVMLFLGILIVSMFVPYGFYIFILTAFPHYLGSTGQMSRIAMSITMLIVFIIFTAGLIYQKFEIDTIGTIIFFCPIVGYLLSVTWGKEKKDGNKKKDV